MSNLMNPTAPQDADLVGATMAVDEEHRGVQAAKKFAKFAEGQSSCGHDLVTVSVQEMQAMWERMFYEASYGGKNDKKNPTTGTTTDSVEVIDSAGSSDESSSDSD